MSSIGVWDLCNKLRAERLLITSEIQSLKHLHCDVRNRQAQLCLDSWKASHFSFILRQLLHSHLLVCPENTCSIISKLDEIKPIEAYKHLGHYYSDIGRILYLLSTNPYIVAELLNTANQLQNISTEDFVHSVFALIFGSGTYPTDEKRLLEVLFHLIDVQLVPANNPRLILRKGHSSFSRLYKLFSETLFSAKIFLTAALHDPVMLVLCQDEMFLDIDSSKCLQRISKTEIARRFGTDQTSEEYNKKLVAYRKIIIEKLVLLTHSFIKSILASLPCFPECLLWLVQQMHRRLITSKRMTEEEAHLLCTDLIVTNLLCPAITNPETIGIISDTPISNIARFNLIQIGQIIQTLALIKYESPPTHFQTFITQFSDSPICSIMDILLERKCQTIENMYPTILSDSRTAGEEMLKRTYFLGSVWEINNLISVLKADILESSDASSIKENLISLCRKLPPSFLSRTVPEVDITNLTPRKNRLKKLASRVHNSLSLSPTKSISVPKLREPAFPLEYYDVVIFDMPLEKELTGLIGENVIMDEEKVFNKHALPFSRSIILSNRDKDLLESRPFIDAKRKLRLVLSNVGNLSINRISDESIIRTSQEKISAVLRTLLAEAVNSRRQVLSAHVREVLRCLQTFDNDGIDLILRAVDEDLQQRTIYLNYLQESRLALLRQMSYLDQLSIQISKEKTLTKECIVDMLVGFYLEKKGNALEKLVKDFTHLRAQDEKVECLENSLNGLISQIPTTPMWRQVTPDMNDCLLRTLERLVMSQIYGLAFYPNQEADRHRDEVFSRALSKLAKSITPDHPMLKIPCVLHGEEPWPSAQAEICILNAYKSARDKLGCIIRCCDTISNLVNMAGIGAAAADDITPVLVYVLILANPPALLSNVQYIESFAGKLLNGAEGYWWTQFNSAIEFIKTLL